MKTKDLTLIAMVAAIYATLTILIAPAAYGPLQFRFSEILKPLALKGKLYIYGLTLGLFVANLFSPYVSPWELVWMPMVCLMGGFIAYALRRAPLLAVSVYSFIIAGGVSVVLLAVLGLPMWATFPGIFISELILMTAGIGLIEGIFRRLQR